VNNIEPEVLSQVQKGNHEAFTVLVETYQRPVYNLCYRMLGDANEAEDAAQETFLRVYKNIKHFDHKRPFSTWLLSIAAHHCIDELRKRRMVLISMDEYPYIDPPDRSPGPESMFYLMQNQKRVQTLLNSLNPQDKAAVVMFYWYDFSYEEIATSLSLTVSAVKSRLHRARFVLAQSWQKQKETREYADQERKAHESPAF
jgi:RNA polymerase sigma-70 factor (ECF subfamily)